MILYNNGQVFRILFSMRGSVLPRALPIGLVTGAAGLALALIREFGHSDKIFGNGEAYILNHLIIQILASVCGFLVVMRTTQALSRWMEGVTEVQSMFSKWAAAFCVLNGFFSGRDGPPDVLERILFFRMRLAHWFSLLSCVAMGSLRTNGESMINMADLPMRDILASTECDLGSSLTDSARSELQAEAHAQPVRRPCVASSRSSTSRVESGKTSITMGSNGQPTTDTDEFRFSKKNSRDSLARRSATIPPLRRFNTRLSADLKSRVELDIDRLNEKREMDLKELEIGVIAKPTDEELDLLELADDKVNMVCLWIIQGIVLEVREKTLDVPPPITTRVFQELSAGMLGFSQANKFATVPFPFPFAQMVAALLLCLYVLIPFYVDVFTQNVFVTPIISFFVPLLYNGLNILAIELEEPFGTDSNDVDIQKRHKDFLMMLVDQIRMPSLPPVETADRRHCPNAKITRGIHGLLDRFERSRGKPILTDDCDANWEVNDKRSEGEGCWEGGLNDSQVTLHIGASPEVDVHPPDFIDKELIRLASDTAPVGSSISSALFGEGGSGRGSARPAEPNVEDAPVNGEEPEQVGISSAFIMAQDCFPLDTCWSEESIREEGEFRPSGFTLQAP